MDLSTVRAELEKVRWRHDWRACTYAEGVALSVQLAKEVGPGHLMHERECVALAKSTACDDVLFFGSGEPTVLAVVRLCWHVPRGKDNFPWTYPFADVAAWDREWMQKNKRG
jgi:hypothetical protein